jgi:uncharacterized protein YhaN
MRIEGWHVEGFGVLRDVTQRNLGPGLNVLLGPNEAGKSTLLEFLRAILFGFPLKRGKPAAYAPAAGLSHGGRLFLQTDEGAVTVERFAGKNTPVRVLFADGRIGSELELQQLLRQADDTLFRNVFAVSLKELQDFESLSKGGVRERLFSAGVAGAGRSAREAITELNENADALFKPRSSAGVINQALDQLGELTSQLAAARSQAEGYQNLLEEEERQAARMSELSASATELRKGKIRTGHLVDLWPVWAQRTDALARLATLPAVDEFPPRAAVRFAEAMSRLAAARERLENLDAESALKQCERNEALPALAPALLAATDEVEEHAQSLALHRQNLAELAPSARVVEQAQQAFDQKLRDLGEGWDEERVRSFDLSIPRREEIRAHAEAIAASRACCDRAAQKCDECSRALEQKQRDAERIRQKRDSLTLAGDATLAADEQAVRRLRATMAEIAALSSKTESLAATVRERRIAIEERGANEESGTAAWLPFVLYVVGGLMLCVGVWQALSSSAAFGAALLVTGALLIAAGLQLGAVRRRAGEREDIRAENTARLKSELQEFEAAAERGRMEIERLTATARQDAAALELPLVVSAQALEEKAAEIEARKTIRAEWLRLDEALGDAVHVCAETDIECRAAHTSFVQEEQTLTAAELAWERQKNSWGVPATLSPDGLLQLLMEVERARELLFARDQEQARRLALLSQIEAWDGRTRQIGAAAGFPIGESISGEPLLLRFAELQSRCTVQLELQRNLTSLEAELVSLARQSEAASMAVTRSEAELQKLFIEAGVTEEAAFQSKMAVYEERCELREKVEGFDRDIRARLGEKVNVDEFCAELAEGDMQAWSAALPEIDAALERSATERDQAVREHDAARRRRQALEESADIPLLEAQLETVRVNLESAVRSWRVATLAQALLSETLSDFQRTRQPAVITEAGCAYATITNGRYTRLLPQDDGATMLVEMASGGTRKLEDLSRGTAEQLYLCLRLAFAREFARRGCVLPLVMDDLLVNFDPHRARAVVRLLAEFSTENQVLLFTCHPESAAMIAEEVAEHVHIDLPGPA